MQSKRKGKTESGTGTNKSTKPEIMFVDFDTEVSDKAIDLEFKLVKRLNPKLRKIFISTPSRTTSWGEHNVSKNRV